MRREGDTLLIFLSAPRMEQSLHAFVDFETILARLRGAVLESFDTAQLWLHQALDQIACGSALIIHNHSVDSRPRDLPRGA